MIRYWLKELVKRGVGARLEVRTRLAGWGVSPNALFEVHAPDEGVDWLWRMKLWGPEGGVERGGCTESSTNGVFSHRPTRPGGGLCSSEGAVHGWEWRQERVGVTAAHFGKRGGHGGKIPGGV